MDGAAPRWREARRDLARGLILDAAWDAVRENGLGGLSLRRLAERAGITTPTVYAYFPSKVAIYDAMFFQAASAFEAHMTAPYEADGADEVLLEGLSRFLAFCAGDAVRYQVLFERVIPDFEPSAAAYQPAIRALDSSRKHLRAVGVTAQRHVDLWTALTTGLASQQLANDPGGDRWTNLAAEATAMFLTHCRADVGGAQVGRRSTRARRTEETTP